MELRGAEKRHLSPQGRFEKSSGKRREGTEPSTPSAGGPATPSALRAGGRGQRRSPRGSHRGGQGLPSALPSPRPLPPRSPPPSSSLPLSICRPRSSRRIPAGSRAGRSAMRGMGEPSGLRWALPRSDPLTSVPRDFGYSAEAAAVPVTGETAPGSAARRCGHWLPGAVTHSARPAGWRSGSRTEKGERQYPAPEDYNSRRALREARSLRPWGAGRAEHDGARSPLVSPSRLASPWAPAGRAVRRRGLAAAVRTGLGAAPGRERDPGSLGTAGTACPGNRAQPGAPDGARGDTESPRLGARWGREALGAASDRCAAPLKPGNEVRQTAQGKGTRGREQRGTAFYPGRLRR